MYPHDEESTGSLPLDGNQTLLMVHVAHLCFCWWSSGKLKHFLMFIPAWLINAEDISTLWTARVAHLCQLTPVTWKGSLFRKSDSPDVKWGDLALQVLPARPQSFQVLGGLATPG